MTEFQSRRELREAERQGLVPKPEQVFDLPTGSIRLPVASEMLTRKRIREMEREGLLDPLTGAVPVSADAEVETETEDSIVTPRSYDEVLAETEEPITSSITAVIEPFIEPPVVVQTKHSTDEPVAATDIFHSMAVDVNARKPRLGIVVALILLVLVGAGASAYMLGIFK